MTRCESWISGVRGNCSTNCATNTNQLFSFRFHGFCGQIRLSFRKANKLVNQGGFSTPTPMPRGHTPSVLGSNTYNNVILYWLTSIHICKSLLIRELATYLDLKSNKLFREIINSLFWVLQNLTEQKVPEIVGIQSQRSLYRSLADSKQGIDLKNACHGRKLSV